MIQLITASVGKSSYYGHLWDGAWSGRARRALCGARIPATGDDHSTSRLTCRGCRRIAKSRGLILPDLWTE